MSRQQRLTIIATILGSTIAILGAVIAGEFESTIDDELGAATLSPKAESAVADAKQKPLGAAKTGGLPEDEARAIDAAVTSASERGFHIGMALAGTLMIAGGVVAGVGIRNLRRPVRTEPENVPRAATAGECGRSSGSPPPGPPRPIASPR